MMAFVLIDLLRALHYGLPSTLSLAELLLLPTPASSAALEIYNRVVYEHLKPPAPCEGDAALIALVAILADIHTLAIAFHPLGVVAAASTSSSFPKLAGKEVSLINPYIPFSPSNENRLARRRLQRALDLWAEAFLTTSNEHVTVLYHFCNMYLNLPSMQILPALVKYPPRSDTDGRPSQEQQDMLDAELKAQPKVQKSAWLVLEHVQHDMFVSPTWLPLAVFYAALVIWRMVHLQAEGGSHGSRKVLLLFKAELNNMCWPCCTVMAATLDSLLA